MDIKIGCKQILTLVWSYAIYPSRKLTFSLGAGIFFKKQSCNDPTSRIPGFTVEHLSPSLLGCPVGEWTRYTLTPRLMPSLKFLRPRGVAKKKGVSKPLKTLQDVSQHFRTSPHPSRVQAVYSLLSKKPTQLLVFPRLQALVLVKAYEFWQLTARQQNTATVHSQDPKAVQGGRNPPY